MNPIDKAGEWVRENAKLLRTGSTLAIVLIVVLYFYGFRARPEPTINDIVDILLDVFLFLFAVITIMREFALRGKERVEDSDELKSLLKEHAELTQNIDEDKLSENLVYWNDLESKIAMREKKNKKVKKLKDKRRKLITKKMRVKQKQKKLDKIQRKIEFYQDDDVVVRAKYEHLNKDDVMKGKTRKKSEKPVGAKYDAASDAVGSQLGAVIIGVVITTSLRLLVNPTLENVVALLLFLVVLAPIATVRAVFSYLIAIHNAENKTPLSLKKRIKVIKWCMNFNNKKEGTQLRMPDEAAN